MKKLFAPLLLSAAFALPLVSCGGTPQTSPTPLSTPSSGQTGLQLGMAYGAPNGSDCFGHAYVAVQGDTIIAAFLDEFQFMDTRLDLTYVPNSDSDLAAGYAQGQALASKRDMTEYYSRLMVDYAKSTVPIHENFNAIQRFTTGKTIRQVRAVAEGGKTAAVDTVSGATLVNTANYLALIAQAAENAQRTAAVDFTGEVSGLKLNVTYGAAHGTSSFAVAAALTDGDTILLSYLDEFQFLENDLGLDYVPNSDSDLAAGFADGQALASKRMVTDYYSQLMQDYAQATVPIDQNFDAIQRFAEGKTVSEVQAVVKRGQESAVDTVSGATLTDTVGYLALIAQAAGQ